jgi:hypothetical protein
VVSVFRGLGLAYREEAFCRSYLSTDLACAGIRTESDEVDYE